MTADVIVVGSGAAGISAALAAARRGLKVLLVTKALTGGSTPLAQGGLAAALGPSDDPDQHAHDTTRAGAGLCDPATVAALAAAAPESIAALTTLGARLDKSNLRREGGHHRHRIVHPGNDATGAEVHRVLLAALRRAPVEILDRTIALDLVPGGLLAGTVDGESVQPEMLTARSVLIACGGLGQAFATTTNPSETTGDGIALALRAGLEIRDPEFVQFHPTVLYRAGGSGQRPLITEALRGAGAVLRDGEGRPLMAGRHPLGDLAPRDVVSAAMAERLQAGDEHLWLDATGVSTLETGFPTVTAACRAQGVDPVAEPIPVSPGAHYFCGGVLAGLDGRTSLPGLYVVGEAASTGVHGANRLASNSVTEALIAGTLAGNSVELTDTTQWEIPASPPGASRVNRQAAAVAMSQYAGVVRDAEGLRTLLGLLGEIPSGRGGTLADIEAANLRTVSVLIAAAALARDESRGCHRRRDAPSQHPGPRHTLARWDGGRLTVGAAELVAP